MKTKDTSEQVIAAARAVIRMVKSTPDHTCWFDSLARLMKALEAFDSETSTSEQRSTASGGSEDSQDK